MYKNDFPAVLDFKNINKYTAVFIKFTFSSEQKMIMNSMKWLHCNHCGTVIVRRLRARLKLVSPIISFNPCKFWRRILSMVTKYHLNFRLPAVFLIFRINTNKLMTWNWPNSLYNVPEFEQWSALHNKNWLILYWYSSSEQWISWSVFKLL